MKQKINASSPLPECVSGRQGEEEARPVNTAKETNLTLVASTLGPGSPQGQSSGGNGGGEMQMRELVPQVERQEPGLFCFNVFYTNGMFPSPEGKLWEGPNKSDKEAPSIM